MPYAFCNLFAGHLFVDDLAALAVSDFGCIDDAGASKIKSLSFESSPSMASAWYRQ